MNNCDTPLFRHEEKFIITPFEAEIIKSQVALICSLDPHADENGVYNIKSIYFDTINDRFLNETIDGVNSRHKYRIRTYNNDLSRISLEKKLSENGLKRKESDLLSLDVCRELSFESVFIPDSSNLRIVGDLQTESLLNPIVPKVMIGYERIPFVYPIGNVRITFDSDIIASENIDTFYEENITDYVEVLPGQIVLEVKYDEFLPSQIRNILNQTGILSQSSFSKYAMGRNKINEGAYV